MIRPMDRAELVAARRLDRNPLTPASAPSACRIRAIPPAVAVKQAIHNKTSRGLLDSSCRVKEKATAETTAHSPGRSRMSPATSSSTVVAPGRAGEAGGGESPIVGVSITLRSYSRRAMGRRQGGPGGAGRPEILHDTLPPPGR